VSPQKKKVACKGAKSNTRIACCSRSSRLLSGKKTPIDNNIGKTANTTHRKNRNKWTEGVGIKAKGQNKRRVET